APARDRFESGTDVRHFLHPLADAGEIGVGLVAAWTAQIERGRWVRVDAVGADDVVDEPALLLEAAHMRLAALVQNRLRRADHVHRIPPCSCCDKAAGARSPRLATDAVEDRRPAHALILKESRRLLRPDVEHWFKAELDKLGLEGAIGHRLLGHRVETL